MFKNLPRSSSPISKDKNKTFAKDFTPGLSFPGDFLDETGNSTRSLLAHRVYSSEEEDKENQNREEEIIKSNYYDQKPSQIRGTEESLDKSAVSEPKSNGNAPNMSVHSEMQTKSPTDSKTQQSTNRTKSKSLLSSFSSSSTTTTSRTSSFLTDNDSEKSLSFQNTRIVLKGKTWDDWVLEKAIFDMERMKLVKEKQKQVLQKRQTLQEEKIKREHQAEDNRKEWLKQKTFELEKNRRELLAQNEFEKLKEKQEREILEEKAKDNFEAWCTRKQEEGLKQRLHQKQMKNQKQERLIQKRVESENAYKKWLNDSRRRPTKKKTDSPVHSFYNSSIPSYTNPLPWVSAVLEEEQTVVNNKQKGRYCSPPLLWLEREEKQKRIRRLSRKASS